MMPLHRPPPPEEPRGGDAPEDDFTSQPPPSRSQRRPNKNNGYPDLFDDQYSSGESDSPTGQNGNSRSLREPPSNARVGKKRGSSQRKGAAAVSSQSQDPPNEYHNNRGSGGQRGKNFNNHSSRYDDKHTHDNYEQDRGSRRDSHQRSSRGKSPRTPNHSSRDDFSNNSRSSRSHFKRFSADDYPLQDDEEELYEQYQDDRFHQQSFVHAEHTSSQYGQFNIAPLVEMTPMNGKSKKQKKSKQGKNDDGAWQPSKGRYSEIPPNQNQEDVEHDIDDMLDAIPATQHKNHKEFYNFDPDKEDESSSDDDEERPLRRSDSSSSFYIQRKTAKPESFMEKCLNRTLITVIALLTIVYIRDHTTWYKEYQSRVAMEKYENELTTDPMSVYNTNDDDSTHTKDHDPTNKYNKFTAGERISDRKPEKSLHHGFMDENYENRPAAKNSGIATAKKVKDNAQDPETAAFLASVSSSSSGKKKQPPPPPPPQRPVEKTALDSAGFNSGGLVYSNNDGSGSTGAPGVVSMVGGSGMQSSSQNNQLNGMQSTYSSSFTSPYTSQSTGRGQQTSGSYDGGSTAMLNPKASQGQTYSNSYEDAYSEGMKNGYYSGISNQPIAQSGTSQTQAFTSSNYGGAPALDGQLATVDGSGYSTNNNLGATSSEQSMLSSSQSIKVPPQPQSSMAASSAFDQAMITQDIKSVYKDSFFRWNHPFRHEGNDEVNGVIDVPVFWRIPRSASGVVEATMSYCYGLTLASAMGAGFEDGTLQRIKTPTGAVYVNVDVSTPDGIKRAADMNLGSSRVADVISSPFIYETTALFSDITEAGKCFTLLRHPVDRAVSFYHHYQQEDSTHPNAATYRGMTIDEYAEASSENNWMVRFLTSKRSGTLSWHDLEAAKEVFGRKCLVGLSEQAEESIRRYARFFQWDKNVPDLAQKESCLKTTLTKHDKREKHPTYEGFDAWEVLRKKNEYDVLLYEYAKNLFSQQTVLYENFG